MDDKGSVGKISVSSDSVSTLNSEDFVLVSRLGDETPSSTNNGSDDEKTGLKVRTDVGMDGSSKREREEETSELCCSNPSVDAAAKCVKRFL